MRLKPAQQYATIPLSILGSGLLAKLSLIATKTYMVLLLRSDSNRNQCWPAIRTIAADANMSTTSVLKAITELEGLGLIVKQHRMTKYGDAASNLYTVMVPDYEQNGSSEGVSSGATPCITPCNTPYHDVAHRVAPNDTEQTPIEPAPLNEDSLTGSADAEAVEHPPIQPPKPKEPKPDPYRSVIETYKLAGLPEPPSSEVTPLLRAMKQALASGWSPARIAAAWSNARARCNPQSLSVWSLAYTLRHLTDAEAMQSKPPGGQQPVLTSDERRTAARDAVMNAFGGALNER